MSITRFQALACPLDGLPSEMGSDTIAHIASRCRKQHLERNVDYA